jgi:hypothetical protein
MHLRGHANRVCLMANQLLHPIDALSMTTVQLAITDAEYAQRLQRLLTEDGEHRVVVVNSPSQKVPGVIVVESGVLGDLSSVGDPSRFVVIESRRAYYRTSQLWRAGFRRIVFTTDPPVTTYLAILSTEQGLLTGSSEEGSPLSGLRGPFELSDPRIDAEVGSVSAGVYLLGHRAPDGNFQTEYVGRADRNLNNQLHIHVGSYTDFHYESCSSAQVAFETECAYYHELKPSDNPVHPRPVAGLLGKCPHCGE